MGLAPTPVAPTQYAARAGGRTAARRARGPESPRWGATLLFLAPASLLLLVFLVYPAVYTVLLSFNRGRNGIFEQWVGLDNYTRLFADPDFLDLSTFPPSGALWNNVLWIVFYVSIVIFLGLINAMLGAVGVAPVSWLGDPGIVNFALISVGIWGSVGFATVILSAAVKSIPAEVIESARVEGATERQIFFRMILPMVSLPMSVLAVTLVVNVIKLFDLIYVMTRGGPGKSSQVIAFTMFQQAFEAGQYGYGSAVAVVMLVLLIPILIFNVRRFRTSSVT